MQGSIKFVAMFLQDHLPESEVNADDGSEDEATDEVNN